VFWFTLGTREVWPDGDKIPRANCGIPAKFTDGGGAQTENAGRCTSLLIRLDKIKTFVCETSYIHVYIGLVVRFIKF